MKIKVLQQMMKYSYPSKSLDTVTTYVQVKLENCNLKGNIFQIVTELCCQIVRPLAGAAREEKFSGGNYGYQT